MGHYAIDKMSLRARETVYWPGINRRHKAYLSPLSYLCKVCKNSTKRDTAVHRNTTNRMGTTGTRHFYIKKHTISPSN